MARSYNANKKRAERQNSQITIGDREDLKPAPETTKQRAQLRKLAAKQAAINTKAAKLAETDDADSRLDEAVELDAQAEAVLYQQVALMLVGGDGKNPDPKWLADELSPAEVPDVISFVQGEDATTTDPS